MCKFLALFAHVYISISFTAVLSKSQLWLLLNHYAFSFFCKSEAYDMICIYVQTCLRNGLEYRPCMQTQQWQEP